MMEEAVPEVPKVEIALSAKQRDIVIPFRFFDVGYEWVTIKGNKLLIPVERLDDAISILANAVDITREWVYEPAGRAEHQATVALYEKVRKAKELEAPAAEPEAVEREAKIKYFRQQEVKWREAAYKIAGEERGEALFAEAIRKADEFGRQASELEALGLPAMSVVEYDRRYTLEELREMARQAGLSASGSKKEIAAKLIAKGVK